MVARQAPRFVSIIPPGRKKPRKKNTDPPRISGNQPTWYPKRKSLMLLKMVEKIRDKQQKNQPSRRRVRARRWSFRTREPRSINGARIGQVVNSIRGACPNVCDLRPGCAVPVSVTSPVEWTTHPGPPGNALMPKTEKTRTVACVPPCA